MASSQHLGTALVTGASSGIGAVYADRLAHRNYDLVLVARRLERLEEIAKNLSAKTGRKIDVLAADLNNHADLGRVEALLRAREDITLLVNNAGFGSGQPLLKSDVDKMEEMVGLNVTALMRLTYAAVSGFVARGRGAIVNIASIVAVAPEFLNGVYGGTKAFVLAFSQSLRHELASRGIKIQVVLPGGTTTEFWDIAGSPLDKIPPERRSLFMSTEDLVDAALAGFDQDEFVTLPTLPDVGEWEAYEAARQKLLPHLRGAFPAERYHIEHEPPFSRAG